MNIIIFFNLIFIFAKQTEIKPLEPAKKTRQLYHF